MRTSLLACCAILAAVATADAGVPPDARERFGAAVSRFDALAQKTQAEDRLPQLSRPDERPVLEAIWDESILGQPPYTSADLEALEDMGTEVARIAKTYLGGDPPSDEDVYLMRIPPVVLAHAKTYPDEIVRGSIFGFQIAIDRLSALAGAWTKADAETRKGLEADIRQLRDAINRQIVVASRLLAGSGPISEDLKTRWADHLAQNAAVIADATPQFAREAFVFDAKSTLPKVPEALRPKLEALIVAMSTRPCDGFCRVP